MKFEDEVAFYFEFTSYYVFEMYSRCFLEGCQNFRSLLAHSAALATAPVLLTYAACIPLIASPRIGRLGFGVTTDMLSWSVVFFKANGLPFELLKYRAFFHGNFSIISFCLMR